MVPYPVRTVSPFGVVTPGIGVQSVGFVVIGGGVVPEVDVAGRQTCHVTVAAEAPVTLAENSTELFSSTVSGLGLMVMPTGVEFPPQPAAQAASSTTAPTLHDLIAFLRQFPCGFHSASTTAAARFSPRSPLLARN